jgi:mono/diheme cytochrome c family protein
MRSLTWTILALSCYLAGCGGGGGVGERGDTNLSAPKVDATVTPDDFLKFINDTPEINSYTYSYTYYKTVDPHGRRNTLDAWKTANGFESAEITHVTFRDTKDLGYGRDMYAWERPDCGYAIYVDNYVVELEPGDATTYGPLNLDAAIDRNQDYHIGTNAIEFGPIDPPDPSVPVDCSSPTTWIAKFFAFSPKGSHARLDSADLDGRGVKYMPTMCLTCHGGTMYPVKVDGSFDPISLKSPKLAILEQDSFQFSGKTGYRETDQQAGIRQINQWVFESYVQMGQRADSDTDQANWYSNFAKELVSGAYGDTDGDNDFVPVTPYNADFIPTGWEQTPERPDGVETLYKQVIAPHCIGCHALRGTKVAEGNPQDSHLPNSVNFSSYEKFHSYNDMIIDYVYRRGNMPRSLINFSQFWNDTDGDPTLLATYLDGFNVFDSKGKIVMPGRPVAKAGGNRTVRSVAPMPTQVLLNASASMFTKQYLWTLDKYPPNADPNLPILVDAATSTPVLSADTDGDYTIKLVTSNALGSDQAYVTITLDSSLTVNTCCLNFEDDIKPILNNNGTCSDCHKPAGGYEGIPVYYDDTEADDLYRRVLARVDCKDPENSLLLRKPTNESLHRGGMLLDPTASVNDPKGEYYNTILNWIVNGAKKDSSSLPCN